jgi:hypothetical protein
MFVSFPISLFVAVLLAALATYLLVRVSRPRITDSAWFWVFAFSTIGLVGVLVIGPKYDDRQKRLEARYEGRERIAARNLAAGRESGSAGDLAGQSAREDPSNQPVAEQHGYGRERRVPLKYLGGALFLAAIGSGYMLWRSERGSFGDGQR